MTRNVCLCVNFKSQPQVVQYFFYGQYAGTLVPLQSTNRVRLPISGVHPIMMEKSTPVAGVFFRKLSQLTPLS